MLTAYTKERLSRPKLSQVTDGKVPETNTKLLELLTPKKPEEFEIADDYSGSDITDPFEEISNKRSVEKDLIKTKHRINNLKLNLLRMQSYSEEFKEVIENLKKNMEASSKLWYHKMEDVDTLLKDSRNSETLPDSLKQKILSILKDEDCIDGTIEIEAADRSEEAPVDPNDNLNAVWDMMKTSKEFVATPPGFDALEQSEPHWLDMPPVPPSTLENAKEKCESWLKNIIDDEY